MKLYCVRHGQANSSDVDPQNGLTEQGRSDIAKVADYLSSCNFHVDHIMHSKKLRAIQTATILSERIGSANDLVESGELLSPESNVSDLVEMIQSWGEDTMLVSHLPFIAKLVSALVVGDEDQIPIVNFTPGTMVCLDSHDSKSWVISWIISPDLL